MSSDINLFGSVAGILPGLSSGGCPAAPTKIGTLRRKGEETAFFLCFFLPVARVYLF